MAGKSLSDERQTFYFLIKMRPCVELFGESAINAAGYLLILPNLW